MIKFDSDEQIESLMRNCLQNFRSYTQTQVVRAKTHGGGTSISYNPPRLQTRPEAARFDIQLVGNIGYILWVEVAEPLRRQGLGTQIYRSIEKFFNICGCERIITTPSGQGREFWPKMGFCPINKNEAEKRLTSF